MSTVGKQTTMFWGVGKYRGTLDLLESCDRNIGEHWTYLSRVTDIGEHWTYLSRVTDIGEHWTYLSRVTGEHWTYLSRVTGI